MSTRRRTPASRRPRPQHGAPARAGGTQTPGKPRQVQLWRPVPALPPPELVVPAHDPAALVRSLGEPPLQGQGTVAEHYLAAVIERAARGATALAAASGLLAPPPPSEEGDADDDEA